MAVAAALGLTVAAAPALGATTTTPATGEAQSSLTLLDVSLGGHSVKAGTIAAVASNIGPHVAQLVVTPATLDGTAYGKQTVTPASAPATVPANAPQAVSVPNLLDLTGPTLSVDAQDGPTAVLTSAALKALGQLTLKPAGVAALPVNLQAASLDNLAKVTATQTEASKSIVIGGLSLPSINGLLSGLGVDLNALLDQLTQANLDKLAGLVGANLTTLNTAVDTAQAAIASAPDTLAGATASLTSAQATQQSAQTTLAAANTSLTNANNAWSSALTTALGLPVLGAALTTAGVTSSTTPQQYLSLLGSTPAISSQTLIDAANAVVSATSAQSAAQTALDAANTVVAQLNALVDALQALVNGVAGAITGNTDPLAALGNITVQTKAVAADTSPTPIAEAKVGTLKVLGADAAPAQLTSALGTVTKTLSDVLTSVPGVTFTPPSIQVGTGKTGTSTVGQTRKANASITGLTITLPSISLPTSLSTVTTAIPGAATIANGVVSVLGGSLKVATLAETASYTPATTSSSTPGTPSGSTPGSPSTPTSTHHPSLAGTGLSRTVPALAALLVVAGLTLRHRRRLDRDV